MYDTADNFVGYMSSSRDSNDPAQYGNYGLYTQSISEALKVNRVRSSRTEPLFSLQILDDTSNTPYFGIVRANQYAADGNMQSSRFDQGLASGVAYNDGVMVTGPNTYTLAPSGGSGIESAVFQIDATDTMTVLWTQADGTFTPLFIGDAIAGRLGYFTYAFGPNPARVLRLLAP